MGGRPRKVRTPNFLGDGVKERGKEKFGVGFRGGFSADTPTRSKVHCTFAAFFLRQKKKEGIIRKTLLKPSHSSRLRSNGHNTRCLLIF